MRLHAHLMRPYKHLMLQHVHLMRPICAPNAPTCAPNAPTCAPNAPHMRPQCAPNTPICAPNAPICAFNAPTCVSTTPTIRHKCVPDASVMRRQCGQNASKIRRLKCRYYALKVAALKMECRGTRRSKNLNLISGFRRKSVQCGIGFRIDARCWVVQTQSPTRGHRQQRSEVNFKSPLQSFYQIQTSQLKYFLIISCMPLIRIWRC